MSETDENITKRYWEWSSKFIIATILAIVAVVMFLIIFQYRKSVEKYGSYSNGQKMYYDKSNEFALARKQVLTPLPL